MLSLLSNWIGWLGIGGAIASLGAMVAGVSWLPGMSVILPILTSALQMVSPIINAIFTLIIWFWTNILWPGLSDILDSWATIVTVVFMGFVLLTVSNAQHKVDRHVVKQCVSNPQPEPELELPWPFKWF